MKLLCIPDEDETDVGYEPQLTESISANTDTTTAIPTTVLQTTQSTTQSTTQATTQATASVASYSYNRAMEAEVLVLINKYRTDAGLAALSSETTIQSWSDLRATEIVSQGIAAGGTRCWRLLIFDPMEAIRGEDIRAHIRTLERILPAV